MLKFFPECLAENLYYPLAFLTQAGCGAISKAILS
jgi:hypothetical protein